MARNISLLSIIPILLFIYSCQFQDSVSPLDLNPTPFQKTVDAAETHPSATVTQSPTAKIAISPTKESSSITLSPTSTEIFPQTTEFLFLDYQELTNSINQIILQAGGRWHIVIKEVSGPTYYTSRPEQRINIASVVKIPLALLFFEALEKKGIAENQVIEHIQSTGTGGRTFEQLLRAMLVKSEEDATEILFEYIFDYVNVPVQLREWQLQGIDLIARRYTANEIASIFERLYLGEFISPTARDLILGYLSEYTQNDDMRIGVIRTKIPDSWQIYNKRGTLLTPYVVADSAILENPQGTDYIITIFAYNGEAKTTYEVLDQAIGEIALTFWNHLSTKGD